MSRVHLSLLIVTAAMAVVARSDAQLIVGHRGASHDAPENTLASFELAWRQGADGIEGDFHLTADNRLICIHDEDLRRLAGDPRRVADLRFDEIRQLDVGRWKAARFVGEHPPTLAQMLATVPDGKTAVVELKTGPSIVDPFVDDLGETDFDHDQLLVIAFDEATIAECKRRLPEVRCHWLARFERGLAGWRPTAQQVGDAVKRSGVDGVGFKAEPAVLTKAFLEQSGVQEFHVWTVDKPEHATLFRDLGAFSITTNRPGWLREQLAGSNPVGD